MTLLLDAAKNPSASARRSPGLSWKSRLSALVIAVLVLAGLTVVPGVASFANNTVTFSADCVAGATDASTTRSVFVGDSIEISSSSCANFETGKVSFVQSADPFGWWSTSDFGPQTNPLPSPLDASYAISNFTDSTPTPISITVSAKGPGSNNQLVFGNADDDGWWVLQITVEDPPTAPTNVSATAGNQEVTVTWSASSNLGGSPHYEVEQSTDNSSWSSVAGTCSGQVSTSAPSSGGCDVTGLTNGTSYFFRIRVVNSIGAGPWGVTASSVTPIDPLPAPSGVTAIAGNARATLTWTAPTVGSGVAAISGYKIEANDGSSWVTSVANTSSTATTWTVAGLTKGNTYTFRVSAINSDGVGLASSASSGVTLPLLPGKPPPPTVVAGIESVTLTVTAGTGGTPTSYEVIASPGAGESCTVTGASGSCTISNLTAGKSYTFQAQAINVSGRGFSGLSAAVTPTAPPAPPKKTSKSGRNENVAEPIAPALVVPATPRMVAAPRSVAGEQDAADDLLLEEGSAPVLGKPNRAQPPSKPVAVIGGRQVALSTSTSDGTQATMRAGSFVVQVGVNPVSGTVTSDPSGTTEIVTTIDSLLALEGSGLQPGELVQVYLPRTDDDAPEIGLFVVGEDGSFAGDAAFLTAFNEPLPIGKNSLQLVSVDENGDQVIVEMAITVEQGAPVPEVNREDGSIPQVEPGEAEGTSAGEPAEINVTALEEQDRAVVDGNDWAMVVAVEDSDGSVAKSETGAVVTLVSDQAAEVSGSGFMAGTQAHVWLFSEPVLLGTVTVGEDGSFLGAVNVDGRLIDPGNHTLQLQGVGEDGFVKAANLGVAVDSAPVSPTDTAPEAISMWVWLALIVLLLAMVVIVLMVARRKRRNA